MSYTLITIQQKKEWIACIKRSAEYDFYHTWHYHALDQSGSPFLFVYQEANDFIAFPLIRRRITDSTLSDFSSVYGYTGPVSNLRFEQLSEGFMDRFRLIFLSFLEDGASVSVFSRLHPLFRQCLLLERFGGLYDNGKTICIDLSVPIEQQRKKYKKNIYESIRKSWKAGLRVVESRETADIITFREIYQENMLRIGASDYYHFSLRYFLDLIGTDEFDCRLILVYNGDEAISGSIVTFTGNIAQCHLMATRSEYLNNSPAKFLVDEISLIGRRCGMQYYHLGGGLGFKEDTLFKWKSGFSDLLLSYKSWRFVIDSPKYQLLVKKAGMALYPEVDFFPLYRYPLQKL